MREFNWRQFAKIRVTAVFLSVFIRGQVVFEPHRSGLGYLLR